MFPLIQSQSIDSLSKPVVLTSSQLFRWYNATYVLFAVSVLLTAVFHRFVRAHQALDDIFNHIDRAIAVLQVMDECIVAGNALHIIKRALTRARGVQFAMQDDDVLSNPHGQDKERSVLRNSNSQQERGNTNIVPEAGTQDMMPSTVDDCVAWLDANPNSLEHYQQALFWKTWAEEVDILGT